MASRPDTPAVPRVNGRKLLLKWFRDDESRTRVGLGARVGVTGQAVSRWLSGSARPDDEVRVLLEHVTGVPADSWMTASERERRKAALARALGESERPSKTGTHD